jgi:protein SCO1/2
MRSCIVAALFLSLAACSAPKADLDVFGAVPHFQLVSQTGEAFDSRALDGKIWVADFIYTTCPGPCPRMTSQMGEVRKAVEKIPRVKLVSFTVDPARDTPPVLADYAKLHNAVSDQWFFLTGSQATLQTLDKDTFKLGDVDGKLMHSTRFVLIDARKQIRGYYDTSDAGSIRRLIEDIFSLAREKS